MLEVHVYKFEKLLANSFLIQNNPKPKKEPNSNCKNLLNVNKLWMYIKFEKLNKTLVSIHLKAQIVWINVNLMNKKGAIKNITGGDSSKFYCKW